jgi:protein SCO1/2
VTARVLLVVALGFALSCASARGESPAPPLAEVGFDQHLGAVLPLDSRFTDERGTSGPLSQYLAARPAVLVLGYYECPNLCSAVRQSLAQSLRAVDLEPNSQYGVIAVSIDPAESADAGARARSAASAGDARSDALRGWHFLTGPAGAAGALARSVGFRYTYDAEQRQFVHPAGIVIVTPRGRIARYFFGVAYPPAELRQSLLDAGEDRVASPARALLLFCLHYDPATGKYSATIESVTRAVGLATAAALALLIVALRRRERKTRPPVAP